MNDQEPLLDFGIAHRVRGRGVNIRLRLDERVRAAKGYRQAVVKVTSYASGRRQVAHHLSYISRNGKLELETDRGETLTTPEDQMALLDRWVNDFDDRTHSRDTVNIVFSMPPGSSTEALKNAVRSVLSRQFPDHESVFAIHEDRQHPHAHTVIKMRGREGDKKLRLNKPELYKLREVFAEAAREQGVMLSATPRAARGVGPKGERQAIRQLKARGILPEVEKKARQEAAGELVRGDWTEHAWERAMRERNERERKAYLEEAQRLRTGAAALAKAQKDQERQQAMLKVAATLERFSRTMPEAKTRRRTLKEKTRQKILDKQQEKARPQNRGAELGL